MEIAGFCGAAIVDFKQSFKFIRKGWYGCVEKVFL